MLHVPNLLLNLIFTHTHKSMEGGATDLYDLRPRQPKKQLMTKKRTRNAAAGQESESIFGEHPKRKRSPRIPKVAELKENHSSNNETVDERPIVSEPEPPSTSGGFITNDVIVSRLISKIKEAQDSSVMSRLWFDASSLFDAIDVPYKPLDEVVSSLIRCQMHKEILEQQKPVKAFEKKKALHDKSISEVSICKEKKTCVDSKYKDVQHRCDDIIAHFDRLKEELKIVGEEKVKCEGEVAITLAEKVQSDKLYCEAELKWKNTKVGVAEAQANIEKWERDYNESVDRVNLTKEKLSHLTL